MVTKTKRTGRPKTSVRQKIAKIELTVEKLSVLYAYGWTDEQVAKFLGLERKTIDRWKHDSKFMHHLKKGKEIADQVVVRSLFERAKGYSHPEDKIFCNNKGKTTIVKTIKHYPPDTLAAIFWLKNRKPDEWRDRQEIGITIPEHLLEKYKGASIESLRAKATELLRRTSGSLGRN